MLVDIDGGIQALPGRDHFGGHLENFTLTVGGKMGNGRLGGLGSRRLRAYIPLLSNTNTYTYTNTYTSPTHAEVFRNVL
ncbi:hypothetical protein [Edaphobacter albus]|uniref:hypothetical protein n=1 Tax=Edaphobacter sp. 4G125 TaxID=2763071 RepID=UPI001644B0C5|nr:hypothetical protein [Edaphobacter sp. 4G125]QNI37498.1 hypothetical protein H7846_04130 [Edaphobacter sp. 4G125]